VNPALNHCLMMVSSPVVLLICYPSGDEADGVPRRILIPR